jgi:hypothetical protein
MGLEAASFVNDLVITNPLGSDGKSQGDDHLRLVKTVLKATFPNAVGARKFSDTDAGATDTLVWTLWRNSATPAPADLLASYAISGNNSAAAEKVYARMEGRIDDATAGTEDGSLLIKTIVNGAETLIAEMNAFRPVTVQTFISGSGTWTKPAGCRKILIEGVGGGGGGGGVSAASAQASRAAGGGASGAHGISSPIDVTAFVNGTYAVGAAGTAGNSSGGDGGAGGSSTVTINAVVYTFGGGAGGKGATLDAAYPGGLTGNGNNVNAGGMNGIPGVCQGATSSGAPSYFGVGGDGGKTSLGPGGKGGSFLVNSVTAGSSAGAAPASGNGGGGGGATNANSGIGAVGGVGTIGMIRIWEFY